jgi:DNA-binding NtrC family response regulator
MRLKRRAEKPRAERAEVKVPGVSVAGRQSKHKESGEGVKGSVTDRASAVRCQDANAPDTREAILIVDNDPAFRNFLECGLRHDFSRVYTVANAAEARALARHSRFDILVVDIHLAGETSGLELTRELRDVAHLDLEVVFTSGNGDLNGAVAALQDDAANLLRKPFPIEQLLAVIKRARRQRMLERENYLLNRGQLPAVERLVGKSEPVKELWRIINRIAPMPSTVLITGETGTGKELVSRALHDLSGRRGSYVPVNCGAISPELMEGELFGHLKGAFTGAHQAREGLFSHADGGTLLLDEIGEMPLGMQAKLLRVLETRSYRPVGGNREISVNARVIAATNRHLPDEVLAGRFRKDLFYRLNIVELRLPPLRERRSDIPRLARFFMNIFSAELGVPAPELSASDLEQLMRYQWPGNIRELRNVIERSLLLGTPPSNYVSEMEPSETEDEASTSNPSSLDHVERSHILNALRAADGNKTEAARILGVSRKTVGRKLKEWGATCGAKPSV